MHNFYQIFKNTQEFKRLFAGFFIVILIFSTLVFSTYYNLEQEKEHAQRVVHSQEEIYRIERIISLAKDYETASRGFVITNNDAYKEPFKMADDSLKKAFTHLEKLIEYDPVQQNYRKALAEHLKKKIALSRLTMKVRQEKGLAEAVRLVSTNKGKILMDKIREIVAAMQAHEHLVLNKRKKESEKAALQVNLILLAGLVIFILLLVYILKRGWNNLLEKKAATERLRQQEEHFRALIENNSEAIVLRDENSVIKYWSPAAVKILGWTKEEIAHQRLISYVHPEDLEQIKRQNQEILNYAGVPVKGLNRVRHKDGHYVWLEGETINLLHQKSVQAIVSNFRDVSDRIKADQEIQKANALLAKAVNNLSRIMESSPDVICSINAEGKFVQVSAAAATIWGFAPEELIGRAYMDMIAEQDKEVTTQIAGSIMNGVPVTTFENRYIRRDGSLVPVLWSATWNEEDQLMYCVAKDATEKKKLEKAYRNEQKRFNDLFVKAPSSICILKGPEHQFVATNSYYDELVGNQDLTGRTVKEAFPELADQDFVTMLDQVYQTGQPYVGHEQLIRPTLPDSSKMAEVYLNMVCQPYTDTEDKVEGIFFYGVNVTEQVITRKRIEESERNFRQLIQDLPAAVYTCDAEGYIQLFNRAAADLWGRNPVIGLDRWCGSWKIYDAAGQPMDLGNCPMALTLESGTPVHGQEIIIERPAGDRRWVKPHPVLNFNSAGQMTGGINILIDITESKNASETISRSEAALAEAQHLARIGSWNMEMPSQRLTCSKELYQIFEIDKNAFQGTFISFLNFVNETDQDLAIQTIQRAFSYAEPIDVEYRITTGKGAGRIIHVLGKCQTDNYGKVTRLYGTAQDITERKLAEKQLKESEKNLKAILSSSQEAIYLLDLNLRLVLNNDHCVDIMKRGYGVECRPGDDFLTAFEPDFQSKMMLIYQKVLGGEKWESDRIIHFPEGDAYYYSNYFPVRDNDGNIIGICCSSKNITQRRKIEEAIKIAQAEKEEYQYRFKAILDYSPQAILIKDTEGKHIFSNKAFLNLFDLDRTNEVGMQLKAVLDDQVARNEFLASDQGDSGQLKSRECKQQITLADGETLELEIIKFPLYDRQKRLFGICTLCKDITEQIKHQQQLILARENAEQAERLQEQFLANMSHELRTPMNGIIGMVNLLLTSASLQLDQKEQLQIIKRSSDTLLTLINDILDLSKIKAGMLTIEEVNFDFNESITGTALLFKERAREKGIKLAVSADPFIPKLLSGDPHRLNQILNNLLSNAIKFTEKGFVRLEASLQSESEDQIVVEFIVSDSGIGIDSGNLSLIFDNFAQASSDISSKYGGTGLGLAITKRLIEMQGGEIAVESTKGVGTTFTFQIPYTIIKDTNAVANPYHQSTPVPVKRDYSGKRALIVEDNDINQAVLASSLKQYHLEVSIANHGQEAIRILETGEHFDIIFMDLRMPVMNGFEATAYIRQKLHLDVPIIILTASVLRNERDRSLDIGASDYMAKPFAIGDLARVLEQFVSTPHYHMETNSIALPITPASVSDMNFDISRLIELKDAEYIRQIFNIFAETMPSYLAELKSFLPSGSYKKFLDRTHRIKGSLSAIEIAEIYQLILRMEEQVEKEKNLNGLEFLLDQCLAAYSRIIPAIEQEVKKQLLTPESNL